MVMTAIFKRPVEGFKAVAMLADAAARRLKSRALVYEGRLRGLHEAAQAAFVDESPPVYGPGA